MIPLSLKKILISWILSSVSMFIFFYAWHGIILNDFSRLFYPKKIFFIFAAFTYLVIGFVVVSVFNSKVFENFFHRKLFLKGLVKGAVCGGMVFIIATVVGVSFNTGSDMKNLLVDCVWQMLEQGAGGGVVAITYLALDSPFL